MNWFTAILYFSMGAMASFITYMSTDDAVKYFDPATRFQMIMYVGTALAGINNVKAFLSIPKAKNGNGNGHTVEPTKTP